MEFAKGEIIDSPDGVNITNSGMLLKWVAVRGGIYDWAIYCHFAYHSWDFVKSQGNKVIMEKNIKELVKCDNEAFSMYRY